MPRPFAMVGQAVFYALVVAFLGYFSNSPPYRHFPTDKALIKLSLIHGAKRKGGCRRLTAEELAALPPNMRKPFVCPRKRLPVVVELLIDGEVILHESLSPTGLAGDGPSLLYRRIPVDPGRHDVMVRLRDSDRAEGFDYEREAELTLAPVQVLAIDFRSEMGGFVFR